MFGAWAAMRAAAADSAACGERPTREKAREFIRGLLESERVWPLPPTETMEFLVDEFLSMIDATPKRQP
jgi:hypothetical protein